MKHPRPDAIVHEISVQAPAERVFQALAQPELMLRWWWRSKGRFEIAVVEADVRPGGKLSMRGKGEANTPLTVSGEYLEVDPPHALAYTWVPDVPAAAPAEVHWSLAEHDGATRVRLTIAGAYSEIWPKALACLHAYIETSRDPLGVTPVGYVRSTLKDRKDAPRQGSEGAPGARLEILPAFRPALMGLEAGQDIWIFTWLHESRRAVLEVHPRGELFNPLAGVFATRSPDRPNPIGLHLTKIVKLDLSEGWVEAQELEAIDGTPVLDIKPAIECK